ncbi:hypothetical protein D5R81_12760 [Parashewanella spongiae]|uniref:Uncharacterized protein n=1 Tax=Parashewanella spongiae TaxID=342950 RepID=A0A3A6TMQ0_9GAMM|nr:DUF6387 family protein [Parashewanella spongiae]MCL1078799.1 DUF6387 family protein [Parashewanella spongiae]RJY11947.1 hypothetical protein D5R81_12760 [Parashewanella spongiae]
MKKISNDKHPHWPNWFSINNYDCLEELTGEQFINELERRLLWLHLPILAGKKMIDDKEWAFIKEKRYVTLSQPSSTKTDYPAVTILNHVDIAVINEEINLLNKDESLLEDYLYHLPILRNENRVILAVDLATADNKTILGSMEHILDKMRQQLSIPEPTKSKATKASEQTFKKLLNYKVIPLLDLIIHCQQCFISDSTKISTYYTQPILNKLLFKDQKNDEFIKKTFIPFLNQVLNDESFLAKLLSNIRKERYLMSSRLKNILG